MEPIGLKHWCRRAPSSFTLLFGVVRKKYVYIVTSLILLLLVMRYNMLDSPMRSQILHIFPSNTSEHLSVRNIHDERTSDNPANITEVLKYDSILVTGKNLSESELVPLQTWKHLKLLKNQMAHLPNAAEAIKEARVAWENLTSSIEQEKLFSTKNLSAKTSAREKQCPYSLSEMNTPEFADSQFKMRIPCGMIQGSSVTVIGTPNGLVGNFQIDLRGTALPGEPNPPIILHCNVRLHGDKVTEQPIIVQNTWTAVQDWGEEERCPSPSKKKGKEKVDELDVCNPMVGGEDRRRSAALHHLNNSNQQTQTATFRKSRPYFPFSQGYPSVATLRVGLEGIQMTVDGKHITSFAVRETLEPWLVDEVRIVGDLKVLSVLASGLPTLEDMDRVADLESLKAVSLPSGKHVSLFIGIFSTANNFERRMAVRRTWMQYESVRNGTVAVRFIVGLHKNTMVNEELWKEALTYGDTQLMPFVDYYSLITWKTVAICVYGTKVIKAKYIMKTDDDAFVRVDEILRSLDSTKTKKGLLYGLIKSSSEPHRDRESKWFISMEEWPSETYPPWAHGPGYAISHDIAALVVRHHRNGTLKMFKLEDVSMGIWIDEMRQSGLDVRYVSDDRINTEGCDDGYVVAHYQDPRQMLCLWQKLHDHHQPLCCNRKQ